MGAQKTENFIKIPLIRDLSSEDVLAYCKKNDIRFIIPTRDAELVFWAEKEEYLVSEGIGVMISACSAISVCEDKFKFFQHLRDAPVQPIETCLSPRELSSESDRFVVKERSGSASRLISLNTKRDELDSFSSRLTEPIFQPQITGREFSAETWIDQDGKCHGVVLRWRIKVVEGESHETMTFSNPEWAQKIIQTFSMIAGLKGHVLAQVIVDNEKNLYLVEINPRLGGASPLSMAAGLNSIEWSLLEFLDRSNEIPVFPDFTHGLRLSKKNQQVLIR
jgi:carbamoyl-phosphate synthase large subunit